MAEKELTGRIARERIAMFEVPRLPEGIIDGLLALGDASGLVSDTLDELGLPGAVAGSLFKPTIQGAIAVGSALTVRNILRDIDPFEAVRDQRNGMAEFEAHNLAQPGDFLVIDGVAGISNMGGISAQMGKRQGEVAAVVSGGVRDVPQSREVGYPVWATEVTPITGKWRIETVEINGPVVMGGVHVAPGDLVVADDTGVCFVPRARAAEVLAICQKKARGERERCDGLDQGVPLPQLLRATHA